MLCLGNPVSSLLLQQISIRANHISGLYAVSTYIVGSMDTEHVHHCRKVLLDNTCIAQSWGLLTRNVSLWRRCHLSSSLPKEPQGSVSLGIRITEKRISRYLDLLFFRAQTALKCTDTAPTKPRPSCPRSTGIAPIAPCLLVVVCWYSHQGINSLCPQTSSKKDLLCINPQRYAKAWWTEIQSTIWNEALMVTFAQGSVNTPTIASVKPSNTEVGREPSLC